MQSENFPSSEDILSEEFLAHYRNKQPKWGFNGLGYIVYKRTYARTKPNGQTEEWHETLERVIRGGQKIGAKWTREEAEELYDHMFHIRCLPSGRALWQLGTETVDKIGMDSLLNCWQTKASEIEDFIFIIIESMLGGGVGCNLAKEYTQELPRVKNNVKVVQKNTKDADFIIPDSKEGWAELARKILEAYLVTGKGFTYSPVCIRSSGEPIKTFGGIAPGPKPLMDYAAEVVRILENRSGKKLRTQDVADIICCGGQMVKSGGVRRTALILQGDPDDAAYLMLKRWDLGGIPNYRANSNNSILCPDYDYLSPKFWDGYNGNGEANGLLNVPLARKVGRLGESSFNGFSLVDPSIIGYNPCAEATLADKECCNLAELFINRMESREQMVNCAILLYKLQKAIAAGPYHFEATNKIVHKNMRLGLGITGIAQRLDVYKDWCDYTYRELRIYDRYWSGENGWPQSIRLTVIKPSGTLGLLGGATPGGHPGFSQYHIRRVRFNANEPLVDFCRKHGYKVEPEILLDGSYNHDIAVIEFPCKFDENTLLADDCGAIQQLELVKSLQTVWADQAVSVTVYYTLEELPAIKEWLKENYAQSVKSVSFLLKQNHGFAQTPLEAITKDQYDKLYKDIKKFDFTSLKDGYNDLLEVADCVGGACPVR